MAGQMPVRVAPEASPVLSVVAFTAKVGSERASSDSPGAALDLLEIIKQLKIANFSRQQANIS
jgi:hypothetical protein